MLAQTAPISAPPSLATSFYLRDNAGVLTLGDADRVDFLQRMTTNNIARLASGDAAVTILTSPVAKIVHVFTVLAREDSLLLLPAEGEGAALAKHLRGQIFFLDKVKVQDVSDQWRRVRFFGENAADVARAAGLSVSALDDRWQETDGMIALTQQKYEMPGIELLIPTDKVDTTLAALAANGATSLESGALYTAARIAAGRPGAGSELSGEYSPLEVGMEWACADDKGCYTGQEIIARQRTYDKVTRTLVMLTADTLLEAGTPLLAEGREVGKVTSAALDPARGVPVALAVVKRPHNANGSRLLAGATPVEVTVIA